MLPETRVTLPEIYIRVARYVEWCRPKFLNAQKDSKNVKKIARVKCEIVKLRLLVLLSFDITCSRISTWIRNYCCYAHEGLCRQKGFTIDIQLFYRLKCRVPQSAKLYGLPKLHKPDIPMPPIVAVPCSLRIVCGFLNVPYSRRLEGLTICWCNYKGSTLRPQAWQPDPQPTAPRYAVRYLLSIAW